MNSLRNMILTLNKSLKNVNTKVWTSQIQRGQCQNEVVSEKIIENILRKKFPLSETLTVEDVSGGCGAMFNIYIESNDFKGLSIPKQHRIVYDTLKEQIKNIHGLHLETSIPSKS